MTGSSPKAQAAAAAYGSVPTRGSITRQYGTQIGNAEDFTKALVGLLQQGPNIGSSYNSAIAQQGVVNNAAAQRIAAITGQAPQTLGSQAAVGGMGDSSMGNLLARQGAAKAYGAQLPGIAASQGQLARHTLVTAMNQALQARQDAYRQSFVSALGQARQNRFSQNLALQQLGLQKQQFRESRRQFNVQAGEAKREFKLNNALQWAQLAAQQRGSSSSVRGGAAQRLGLTQNELDSHVAAASKLLQGESPGTKTVAVYGPVDPATGKRYITGYKTVPVRGSGSVGAIQAGVPFEKAVQTLVQQGVRPQVAIIAATRSYRNSKSANVYAWETFVRWMAGHGSKQYQKIWHRWNMTSGGPGTERPPHPP